MSKITTLPLGMAPPTIHLLIAKYVAEEFDIKVSGNYLLGAIAPDAILARADYTSEQMNNAHYRKEGIKQSWQMAKDEFLSNDDAFQKGYAVHIMVDVLWLSGIYLKIKEAGGENFDIKKYNEDIRFVEKWLCQTSKYNQLWLAITGVKLSGYNIYISQGELELYKSQKYKSIIYEETIENMQYFSLDQINKFIDKATKRIVKELQIKK